jgi:hypothetical protein
MLTYEVSIIRRRPMSSWSSGCQCAQCRNQPGQSRAATPQRDLRFVQRRSTFGSNSSLPSAAVFSLDATTNVLFINDIEMIETSVQL